MAIVQDALNQPPAVPNAPLTPPAVNTVDAPGANSVAQLSTPQSWGITPDQTVEGRIASVMSANNPIIQMARTQALQGANGRGLLNSSIAQQAGEAAAFQAALPIAQQDATTASKAASYNADEANQFGIKNQDALNTRGGQQQQAGTQLQLQGMQGQTQRDVAGLQSDTQKQVAQLNADNQRMVTQLQGQNQLAVQQTQNANQVLLQTNAQAASAFNQALVSMTNINSNDKMDANAKTQAISQIQSSLQSQLHTLSATSGLGLEQQLNFANYPGFDAGGQFVGFDAAGNTAGPVGQGGIVATGAASGFPASYNGAAINWDAPIRSFGVGGQAQPSLREQYQQYAQQAGAGAMSPTDWYASQSAGAANSLNQSVA